MKRFRITITGDFPIPDADKYPPLGENRPLTEEERLAVEIAGVSADPLSYLDSIFDDPEITGEIVEDDNV